MQGLSLPGLLPILERGFAFPLYDSFREFLESGDIKLNPEDRFDTFRPEMAPWWLQIADAIENPEIEFIYIYCGSQIGKTVGIMCFMLFNSSVEAARQMLVFDKEPLAKDFVTERLKPHLETFDPDCLKKRNWKNDSFKCYNSRIRVQYASVEISSWPCKYVICDEFAKYTVSSIPVIKKRLRTFLDAGGKLIASSTVPRSGEHPSWKEAVHPDNNVKMYFVPCPHCGHKQPLVWQNMKWDGKRKDGSWNLDIVKKTARYQCRECLKDIDESHKIDMIGQGEFRCVDPEDNWQECDPKNSESVCFFVSSLYSPFTSWARLAVDFIKAQGNPEALTVMSTDEFAQLPAAGKYGAAIKKGALWGLVDERRFSGIRQEYQLVVGGVDVQADVLYVVIGGFLAGVVPMCHICQWEIIPWREKNLEIPIVEPSQGFFGPLTPLLSRVCWDISDGTRAPHIITFFRQLPGGIHWGCKDTGHRQMVKQTYKTFEGSKMADSGSYISVNSDLFKDDLSAMLEQRAFTVPADITENYVDHFSAEHKAIDKKGRSTWSQIGSRANHFFSATVYMLVAASPGLPALYSGNTECVKQPRQRKRGRVFSARTRRGI